MARDLSGRIMIAGIAGAALALAVTAAVTFSTVAHSQPSGAYTPVMTNLSTGKQLVFKRSFPDQNRCDAAIAGLDAALKWMVDGNPDSVQPDYTGADPEITQRVETLVLQLWQNTGAVPRLGLSCERLGDPA